MTGPSHHSDSQPENGDARAQDPMHHGANEYGAPVYPVPPVPPVDAYGQPIAPNPGGWPGQYPGTSQGQYTGGQYAAGQYPEGGYPYPGAPAGQVPFGYAPAQPAAERPEPGGLGVTAFILSFIAPTVGLILGIVQTIRQRAQYGRASALAVASIWVGAGLTVLLTVGGFILLFLTLALVPALSTLPYSLGDLESGPDRSAVSIEEFCDTYQDITPMFEPLASLDAAGYAANVGRGGSYQVESDFMAQLSIGADTLWAVSPTEIEPDVSDLAESTWAASLGFSGSDEFRASDVSDAQSSAENVQAFAAETCTQP
ncbi:hypothetical protein D9V32_03180 [Mycetocola tolaasinivorans]|uniref:DUF4190 domain-containing protein n=1 Tax=Mycetocola tolaasinivorans TaxID=76635 RepID=A0A3L7ABV5_9MICO|nr:DUF4190 domain-containing protein [Mycetocola tolaasinivorans]RLP77464.1 hypothetical protein D9V32_03180 [Mycetocola tolaasinivorans]